MHGCDCGDACPQGLIGVQSVSNIGTGNSTRAQHLAHQSTFKTAQHSLSFNVRPKIGNVARNQRSERSGGPCARKRRDQLSGVGLDPTAVTS